MLNKKVMTPTNTLRRLPVLALSILLALPTACMNDHRLGLGDGPKPTGSKDSEGAVNGNTTRTDTTTEKGGKHTPDDLLIQAADKKAKEIAPELPEASRNAYATAYIAVYSLKAHKEKQPIKLIMAVRSPELRKEGPNLILKFEIW